VSITGIKGMNDILPGEIETWQFLEQEARRIFQVYGFSEIRTPAVEKTELFCRSIGETTDIVEKEMYTFPDKSGHSLTLRPEGTAPVMRSFIEKKLYALDPVTKLFYLGPMFRYERPQKGRYRQFHQIGVEAIGVEDPKIDAQILVMLSHYFAKVGITNVALQINSLGCPECRPGYRALLVKFLEDRLDDLCPDCRRRWQSNPLRVLDCKVPGCQAATEGAPAMLDHLCPTCEEHFSHVRSYLDDLRTPYTVNPRMVRGLDYYTKTTFEMVTGDLGAQNAVAAGGRYDGLIRDLGGPSAWNGWSCSKEGPTPSAPALTFFSPPWAKRPHAGRSWSCRACSKIIFTAKWTTRAKASRPNCAGPTSCEPASSLFSARMKSLSRSPNCATWPRGASRKFPWEAWKRPSSTP
jgi:histidyl-tRNA synthetase